MGRDPDVTSFHSVLLRNRPNKVGQLGRSRARYYDVISICYSILARLPINIIYNNKKNTHTTCVYLYTKQVTCFAGSRADVIPQVRGFDSLVDEPNVSSKRHSTK